MADPREFVLIGSFQDGITPELQKINNQLAALKTSFANIGGKGARNASRDLGRFNIAVNSLNETLKTQNKVLRSTIEPMRQYRREVGKTVGALKKLDEAGGRAISIERTNKALEEQIRLMDRLRSRSGGGGGGTSYTRPPRGGGGSSYARPPRGGGGGGGGPNGFHMAEFGFAYTLGSGLAQPIQNAIVAGFQIGVGLMTKPFEYFANRLKERIEDEQSDIKAAGGIFSIARRQKDPFVKTMDEAMEFTQMNNKHMAELAAALPGNTQQYIEVSKRISDSISRIVMSDPTKAIEYSNKLREEEGKQALSGSQQAQTKGAITQLLGEMTKKTVLAGLGTGGGPGGVAGAYGLPQLTERMLTQQEVSMGQFQRYAAIFKDPLIMEALNRFIPKINASAAGTMERFEVMQKFYDEVLPKEMIRKFERSTAGILELFNTTIFGPETGLFGLGRKMEGMGKVMDDYGNYIKVFEDGTRKVVKSFAEASDANLSLFDLLRDSFANLGIALYPILQNLGAIFDPINKVAKLLVDFRHASGEFLNAFESYKKGFEDMVKEMDKAGKAEFMKIGLDLRASLAAVNNFFANAGIINEGQFQANAKQLMSTTFDYKGMISGMLDQLLNSDVAAKLGELIGEIIGTVLGEVAKLTGFVSGRIQGTNKLMSGLKKGFDDAGGPAAFRAIFRDLFMSIGKLLWEIAKIIPLEALFLAGAMVVLPAAVQGLGMLMAEYISKGIKLLGANLGSSLQNTIGEADGTGRATQGRRRSIVTGGGIGDGQYRGRPRRYGAGGSIERLNRMRRARYARGAAAARANMAYAAEPFVNYAKTSRVGQGAMGLAKGAGRLARGATKLVPGGALAAGALDMGVAMASGENFGKAAIGAFGTVLGGTAGTIFGPVGTAIGATLGGMLADASSDFILGALDQNHAAKLQMEAAQKQVDAAASAAQQKYGPELGEKLGGVEALNQALGGGAGVKAYAAEQLRLGKILPEQAQSWDILGTQLTDVNKTTKAVEKAQKAYDNAVKLNTGEQKKYKDMLEKAKTEQEAALSRISSNWESMSSANRIKLLGAADGIVDALNGAAAKIRGWKGIPTLTPAPTPKSLVAPKPTTESPIDRKPGQQPLDSRKLIPGLPATPESGYGVAKGHLGDAIRYEMRNKPPGSDLLIANSSETVIPAAGGYGMKDFMSILSSGFSAVNNQYKSLATGVNTLSQETATKFQQADTTNADRYQKTTTTINNYHRENQQEFAKIGENILQLSQKVATMSSMGGLMGGMGGGMALGGGYGGAGVQIAGQLGNYIKQTGGAPGSIHEHPMHGGVKGKHAPGSYHYSGRAIDIGAYANEQAGVIARIQQFNAKYGVKPVEFLHAGNDPNHQDHVHVAYGLGAGNPAFFGSQSAAERWERSMVSGSVRVGSVTGNSAEGFGGSTVGDIYVTVNAGSIDDPDQLAYMVAQRIQAAVNDATNASILV